MEPESSSPYPQVTAIRPFPEPTHPYFFCGCVILPLETPPPTGDPSGGVVYLRIVLSPEEASHIVGNS